MRLLFVCNTLYQIIVAAAIRQMFLDCEVDLILSDHSTAGEVVYNKIKASDGIFNKVYYVKTKYLYDQDESLNHINKFRILRDINTVPNMSGISGKYDAFFCANAEPFTERVANYVKHTNPYATLNWFEDGLSAYDFDSRYFPSLGAMIKRKIKKSVFNVYSLTAFIDNYYVFKPDKMIWKPRASVKEIMPINRNLAEKLGDIFGFDECEDKYDEKFIFFEDGAQDWDKGADIDILNIIADKIGKNNIIVRKHPRSISNRFEMAGYKTNKDSSIPWEIIAMNLDMKDKILMTMYSQSVITPDVLMGVKSKVISLGELDTNYDNKNKVLYNYMRKKYFDVDPIHYMVPRTMDEFEEIVKTL